MFVSQRDAGVNESARSQLRARLLCCHFEGKLGEDRRRRVVGQEDVVEFGSGALNGAND